LRLASQFGQRLLHDLAQVTALAGIKDDLVGHGQSLTKEKRVGAASHPREEPPAAERPWVRRFYIFLFLPFFMGAAETVSSFTVQKLGLAVTSAGMGRLRLGSTRK